MNRLILLRWAVKFRSKNKLDGYREYFVFKNGYPVLFFSRKEAIKFIKEEYGYLKTRKDLRKEPFGWRIPKAIRITVTLKES